MISRSEAIQDTPVYWLNPILTVEIRNVYGENKVYPVNNQAQILAGIAGTKTLTARVLRLAQTMGFTITPEGA